MNKRCMGCMEEYGEEFSMCPYCGYIEGTPVEEQIHIEPGTIIHDRYIIGMVLGFGGFGVTYIGWDSKLEMKVAVKEYLPSEFSTRMPGQTLVTVFQGEKQEQFREGLDKFVGEAKRLANFKNEEGIVRVYDSFKENDTAYIIMEYLDGETLTEYLEREGIVSEDKAVEMMMPLMKSLKVVHKAGIIHRDIAPDNIFITKDGNTKLIDFGASRYATTSHSRSLTVIIKPGYSPEEQYRSTGDQGPHTDVYALGATLYKMLTGKTPPDAMERRARFEGQNKDILVEPRKLNKEISQVREVAILNAMNVRVQDRTPDVETFIDELESTYPAKRRYGRIKKIDVFSWPLWLKIAVPSAMSLLLVFGILLVTGVISFSSLFSGEVKVPDGYVITPNIEGMSLDDAYEELNAKKLQPKLEDSVISDYVETNRIITQSPAGGQYSKINSEISLIVSKGTGEVIEPINGTSVVPFLVGSKEKDALADCKKAGLNAKTTYEYNESVAEGLVVSQDLSFGTKVKENSEINLVISKGKSLQEESNKGNPSTNNSSQSNGSNNNQTNDNGNYNNNNNSDYQNSNDNNNTSSDTNSNDYNYNNSGSNNYNSNSNSNSNNQNNGNSSSQTSAQTKKVGSFIDGDTAFVYNGVNVVPGQSLNSIKSRLGSPNNVITDESPWGEERTYNYSGFYIKTEIDNSGNETILGITITSSSVSTSKGVKIGDNLEDIVAAYGENHTINRMDGGDNVDCYYTSGSKKIGFSLWNGTIDTIYYSYEY